jgi:hypothetical protein
VEDWGAWHDVVLHAIQSVRCQMGPSGLTLSLSSTPHSASGGGSGVSAEGAKRLLVGRLWRGCRCREEDASGGPLSILFRRQRFAGFFSPRRSEPGCASVSLRVQLRGRSGSRGRSGRLGFLEDAAALPGL